MNAVVSMEEFGSLLQSQQEDALLLSTLRGLMAVEDPAGVRDLEVAGPDYVWTVGWW